MKNIFRFLDVHLFVMSSLVLNAVLGVFIYTWPSIYIDFGWVFFFYGITNLILAMWFFRNNALFQSRLLLLVTIGYFAGLVKAIDPSAAFSPVGIEAQTLEVGAKMFALTSLALLGAFTGLEAGFGRQRNPSYVWPSTVSSMSRPYTHFYFATIIVLIAGYLSARSYGDSVFESAYASGSGEGQSLGNLQAIGVIGMVIAVSAGVRINKNWIMPVLIFLGLYYFVWGILIRGGRTEVMSGLFAVFIAFAAAKGRIASFKLQNFIAIFFLTVFMEAWGALRSTLASVNAPEETIIEGYKRLMELGIYHAGTISGIATTFSNTVHMVENSVVNLDFGKSYFDYLLRTPPEFLYPGRPQDLAWMFQAHGYIAIGGMFELAEAFFNFGLIGCLVVPFIISFVIGTAYRKSLNGHFLWLFVLASILAETFRGAWYQSFAYYKGAVTGVILYMGFMFVANLYSKRRSTDGAAPSERGNLTTSGLL